MRGSMIVRLTCAVGLAGAAASVFAWPKGTPQPNRWELPPSIRLPSLPLLFA